MEPTPNSPPPYQTEDLERTANDFNNLQYFAQYQNDMILYRSDYQIFDNSWRTWKLLERTKRQLQSNITRTQAIIEQMEQQQMPLIQTANRYFHTLYTPEIQHRMNSPEPSGRSLHQNSPITHPQSISPPPFTTTEEISLPMINFPNPESNETDNQRPSTPPTPVIHRNQFRRRCRRCRSTRHQKQNCPRYQCLRCLQFRPGHFTYECTVNENQNERLSPNYEDYDDPDGNLDGER
jgi:hypothetical protein